MSAPTPGPWSAITEGDERRVASFPVRAGDRSLAAVWAREHGHHRVTHESVAEGRANAQLMASAPDLLAALRQARTLLIAERATLIECNSVGGTRKTVEAAAKPHLARYDAAIHQADRAIDKAEGRRS